MKKHLRTVLKWICMVCCSMLVAVVFSNMLGMVVLTSYDLMNSDRVYVADTVNARVSRYLALSALNSVTSGETDSEPVCRAIDERGLEFLVVTEDTSGQRDEIYRSSGYTDGAGYDYVVAAPGTVFSAREGFPNRVPVRVDRLAFDNTFKPDYAGEGADGDKVYVYYYRSAVRTGELYASADNLAEGICDFSGSFYKVTGITAVLAFCFLIASMVLSSDKLNASHKIPYLVVLIGAAFLAAISVAGGLAVSLAVMYDWSAYIRMLIPFAFVAAFSVIWLLVQTVERLRSRTFLENTALIRLARFSGRVSEGTPIVLLSILAYLVLTLAEILLVSMAYKGNVLGLFLAMVVVKLIGFPVFMWIVLGIDRIVRGIRKTASGQFDSPVDTKGLAGPLKRTAEDVNSIGDAMNIALAENMRSERLKAELITNVSHDIKTPLTSIINYVDLLKKEDLPEGKPTEYMQIIDKHSKRLKKLTEDLIEASKASTGNIKMNLEDIDAKVMLSQVEGEFVERLTQADLQTVLNAPQENVTVRADGRYLWRVTENLMGNICKYAMKGTRVYLDLEKAGDEVRMSFKNVSAEPLNISADELKERFVRGDRSRSTEGSGLGLSIAEDLTTLMEGRLDIECDGDLFKVTVTLPSGGSKE